MRASATGKRLQVSRSRADARGERERRFTAFDLGKGTFEPLLGRIRLAHVDEALQCLSGGTVLERGGQVDGRGDRSGFRVSLGAALDS